MTGRLDIIGAPSSAGAYAPGQERAPEAIRAAGLPARLGERGIEVVDRGDVPGFRWRVDRANPRAMNAEAAAGVARAVRDRVSDSLAEGAAILVLGGDCTVELGTVAGASIDTEDVGLIYIDLDTDLNTPESIEDGALDWMGVAHLLGLKDTTPILAGLGPRTPMLRPDQVLLFANDNSTPFERRIIEDRGIDEVRLAQVVADPAGAAHGVAEGWAGTIRAPARPCRRGRPRLLGLSASREHASEHRSVICPTHYRATGTRRRPELGGPDDLRSQSGPR